jgi:large subunit ribosomal protein L22
MHKKDLTNKGEEVVAQAIHRWARVAPRKARMVADLIRGKRVGEALRILKFTVKPSAQPHVLRVLKSAVSNVPEGTVEDPMRDLRIGEAMVDSAFVLKRFRPAPMGRAVKVRKRTCHITLRLTAI